MPCTVWLASYPKSGNTWFRIFIANLLHPELAPLDFNHLPVSTPIAANRMYFDEVLGISSALLTPAEIERLRPGADLELNRVWPKQLLLRKVHDAYTWLADGRPMLGQEPDFKAIYFLRAPWDVAVSMTSHFDCSLDAAIEMMCDPHFAVARNNKTLSNQLDQRLLSWDNHALSWLAAPLSLHLMRYEDMRRDPLPAFRSAVRFLGLPHDDQAIATALEACRFERLQSQEREQRFRETPMHARQFFRSGQIGEGLGKLDTDQLAPLAAMKARVEETILARQGSRNNAL